MREKLISSGVRHLQAYGYAKADAENILTSGTYRAMFAYWLRDNKGMAETIDAEIDGLLAEMGDSAAVKCG